MGHWLETARGALQRIRRDALTLWFACRDPDTPWAAKAIGAFVVAYALSPIDLIPDFIPVLGLLDDLLLLPGLIWLALRLVPPDVVIACRTRADAWLLQGAARPRSRWGAALVVGAWLAAAWLLWRWLAH